MKTGLAHLEDIWNALLCLGGFQMPHKHLRRAVHHRKTEKLGSNDVEQWGYRGNKGSRPGNLEIRCQADNEIKKMTLN